MGFHQKFAIVSFKEGVVNILKELHKGNPRIIDGVEDDRFTFRHLNSENQLVKGCISVISSEIEETIKIQ